jgi:hypothetical protein
MRRRQQGRSKAIMEHANKVYDVGGPKRDKELSRA